MTLWKSGTTSVLLALSAFAQDHGVFRTDTRLVEMEVVVRDSKGPVKGLTKDDFRVFDNGTPQATSTFSMVTSKGSAAKTPAIAETATGEAQPSAATVIFINNLSIGFTDQVQAERRVAEIFRKLPRREPTAVYMMNGELRVLADFTTDPLRISRALESAWGEQAAYVSLAGCAIPPVFGALETLAHELGSLSGRKRILWFANFFPVGSETGICPNVYRAMIKAMNALNEANIAIYPIRATGVFGPPAYSADRSGPPPVGRNPARGQVGFDGIVWAEATGGVAAQNTDVGMAAVRALDDGEITYLLGFSPEALDGSYHELKVLVDRKGVDVRSRAGYVASAPPNPDVASGGHPELLALKSDGRDLATTMQAPYFFTGNERARVHVALNVVPVGMAFQKTRNGFHGEIAMAGTATHANGGPGPGFEETVKLDMKSGDEAEAFTRLPFRYEHQLLLLPGDYQLQVNVRAGERSGRVALPLSIEPWREDALGISGIAFSTETHPSAGLQSDKSGVPLVAGGREFVVSAGNRFNNAGRVYFYAEVYEPSLGGANPATLGLSYRVVDRVSGAVLYDSGVGGIAGYVRAGNPVVPFATVLPMDGLAAGLYRLEVRVGHSSGPDVARRDMDFEIAAGAR